MKQILTLHIGTYGNQIYRYTIDPNTLEVELTGKTQVSNSSYLALSNSLEYIYALTEDGTNSAVSAFRNTPNITHINTITNIGADPCYIIYHKSYLITANYSGGSISVFPTNQITGEIYQPTQTIQFLGNGPIEKRQQSSHIHTVRIIPNTNYLLATDLGADKIWILQLQSNDNIISLTPNTPNSISVPAGYGPRHIAFHKSFNIFYLLNELSGKIIAYSFSEKENNLQIAQIQEIIADNSGAQASADIQISPSGKFLYASNRRQNDGIAIYKIDEQQNTKGRLTQVGYLNTAKHPRNFTFTPCGNILFVASKDENIIQIFKINKKTGLPSDTGKIIRIKEQQPVCIIIETL